MTHHQTHHQGPTRMCEELGCLPVVKAVPFLPLSEARCGASVCRWLARRGSIGDCTWSESDRLSAYDYPEKMRVSPPVGVDN